MDAPRLGAAALLALVCTLMPLPTAAQTTAIPDPSRGVLLLLYSSSLEREQLEGFSNVLRAQVAPEWSVRLAKWEGITKQDGDATVWAQRAATAHDADAVVWLERGRSPGEQLLRLVTRSDPRTRTFRAREPNDFDRYRTLAMAARSLLPDLAETTTETTTEPSAQPVEPAEQPEESKADEEEPPVSAPEQATLETQAEGPAAAATERKRPWTEPESVLGLHGVLGASVNASGDGVVAGVESALGARVHRLAVLRAVVGLLRDESVDAPNGQAVRRNRFALRLMGWMSYARRRGIYQLGVGAGGGSAELRPSSPEGAERKPAALVRVSASAAWTPAEQLFFEFPLSLDLAFGPDAAASIQPFPRVEFTAGLRIGFGNP